MARYSFDLVSILVIDDSPMMRRLLEGMLRAYGVGDIHIATNGAQGLKLLNRYHVDLVITDWLMEPMDGFDFVRLVRTGDNVATPMVPILMMTGHSEFWRVAAARDAGINEFIVKPVTPESLLSRLLYMMEKPRPFVRTQTYFGPDRRRKAEYPYLGRNRRGDDAVSSVVPADPSSKAHGSCDPSKDGTEQLAATG